MKKIAITVLSVFFFLTSLVYAAEQEKIAVAAEGKTAAAKVSGVAARAPYFLIFDESGKLPEAVDNPYKTAKGGAGTSVIIFWLKRGQPWLWPGNSGKT